MTKIELFDSSTYKKIQRMYTDAQSIIPKNGMYYFQKVIKQIHST